MSLRRSVKIFFKKPIYTPRERIDGIEMSETSKIVTNVRKDYIIMTKEEARAVLARLKQADLLLKLASMDKRWKLWT